MFAEETPSLQASALELIPRLNQYGEHSVSPDGCVEVDAAYYGVPSGSVCARVGWTLEKYT
jgi:hypothetical protein